MDVEGDARKIPIKAQFQLCSALNWQQDAEALFFSKRSERLCGEGRCFRKSVRGE
jgi:hypothetical protein